MSKKTEITLGLEGVNYALFRIKRSASAETAASSIRTVVGAPVAGSDFVSCGSSVVPVALDLTVHD